MSLKEDEEDVIRQGYYLAQACKRFGDSELSGVAMVAWRGLHRRAGSRYDGIAVVQYPDGRTTVLITKDRVSDAFRGNL